MSKSISLVNIAQSLVNFWKAGWYYTKVTRLYKVHKPCKLYKTGQYWQSLLSYKALGPPSAKHIFTFNYLQTLCATSQYLVLLDYISFFITYSFQTVRKHAQVWASKQKGNNTMSSGKGQIKGRKQKKKIQVKLLEPSAHWQTWLASSTYTP